MTVFERNDRPGGLLQYGIPTMKLSKEVVMRRVKLLTDEGISFKCNVDVGKDISAAELANELVMLFVYILTVLTGLVKGYLDFRAPYAKIILSY